MYRLVLSTILVFAGLALSPFSTARSQESSVARQWDVAELSLSVDEELERPFDVPLIATFRHESGRVEKAPGFYNGDSEYLIRFTPPTSGAWTYRTESTLAALNKQVGKLQVKKPRAGRRGGVILDPEQKTRFRYQNGESYYPIAFESDWLFALDAENANGIPKTRQLVDSLAKNGFNQIVLNVFAYDVNWKKDDKLDPKYEYGSPRVFPFGGDNTSPDHSTLNVDYFKRFDRVIAYLDQKGVAAHLMIYVWNKRVNWPQARSAEDNRYFDYVVKRYQAYPNIVWDVSKEALGYGHNDVTYITERIERLRRLDQFDRLVTVHDYGYCRRFTKNVDFVSVQLWSSELYGVMRRVRAEMPGKPIVNIEHGGYERSPYVVFTGNYTSPETCLERAWQCVFAGSYPTHYWQGAAWNVVIPDLKALRSDQQPRFQYYRHMSDFIERFQLDELVAGQKKSNAGFCLHNGKDLYLYYVPKECEYIGLRLPKELRGGDMTGIWFDPYRGDYGEPIRKKIVQWPAFKKPVGSGFRILVLHTHAESKLESK